MNRKVALFTAAAACAALAAALTGCTSGASSTSSSTSKTVTIRVQGMPVATDTVGLQNFQDKVTQFEKANPNIKVVGSTNVWDSKTFAAKLAGGNIEDVIQVPLTEPQGLIARGQVADITSELSQWSHYKEINSQAIKPLKDSKGKVYGVPQSLYAEGLNYNRKLFEEAGLDPDDPPTTWDEVRADAKAITDATGKPGFAVEGTQNQGGWQLAMLTYAFGGDMEKASGKTYKASFDSKPTKDALQLLHDMRFTDGSLSKNALYDQNSLVKDFAAGKVGMFLGTPGLFGSAKVTYGMPDPDDFAATSMPQQGGDSTLSGGQVYMIPKSVGSAERAAAVKWLTFAYLDPAYDPATAAASAKKQAANPQSAVGIPSLPLFSQEVQDKRDAAIKPYVTVKLSNFQAYKDGTAKLKLKAEPPAEAQALYESLDPVVQAVITQSDADIDSLLSTAQKGVNQKIAAAAQ